MVTYIEINEAKDLECLKNIDVQNVEKLNLSIHKPISLKFLKDFKNLKELVVAGSLKNHTPIALCTNLESLGIIGTTIDSLDFICDLSLKWLALEDIKSKVERLEIPNLPTIEYLGLRKVSKIHDLDFLAEFMFLRHLTFGELKSTHLFSFSKLEKLETLHLYKMKHLTNISELETAKNLKELIIMENTPKLKISELSIVSKIKNLEKLNIDYITENNPNAYKKYIKEIGFEHLLHTASV